MSHTHTLHFKSTITHESCRQGPNVQRHPLKHGVENWVSTVTLTTVTSKHFSWESSFVYSLDITNKGIETPYRKIQNHLTTIDLSSNKFEGEILEVIGNLKGLHLLNLSNNILIGHISPSFGNLIELKSLDLSKTSS